MNMFRDRADVVSVVATLNELVHSIAKNASMVRLNALFRPAGFYGEDILSTTRQVSPTRYFLRSAEHFAYGPHAT
jgi:hypothetical protein